jgi:uncharacterized caspase-like protein
LSARLLNPLKNPGDVCISGGRDSCRAVARLGKWLIGLLLAAVPLATFAQTDDPRGMKVLYREPRSALVIGNSAYASSPLANPVNDAEAMARLLEKRNFKVTLIQNADLRRMEAAVELFGKSLGAGGVGLFFYAGHGMQIEGRNYLIPVGAEINNERDVTYNAFNVGKVLGKMEDAGNRLNIVFLDACRDNPFARSFRTAQTGLAQMDAPSGTLIAYATAPGKVAADGVDGSNSVYTRYLLEQLGVPGQEIGPALRTVRGKVIETTRKQQVPWESTSLTGAFYITPIDMLDENLALSRAQLESLRKLQSEQAQAAANLNKLEMEKNAEMAKLDAEIARLRTAAQQPGAAGSSLDQLIALGDKRAAAEAELAAAQRKAEQERQKREAEIAQVKAAARAKHKAEFEAAYAKYQRVCEYVDKGHLGAAEHQAAWQAICGDFGVKNPGDKPAALAWNDTDGTVQLASLRVYGLGGTGSPPASSGTPATGRNWTSPATGMEFVWVDALKIWVGKYEVTNSEYRRKESGHDSKSYENHSLNGERQPVVQVNFDDAKAYAAWLTERDKAQLGGMRYRVPSEQEYMTYAQCGDGREYPWGNNWPPRSGQAGNYADQTAKRSFSGWTIIDGYDDGHPVACDVEKSWANPWGLYGVGGNVWEACASDSSGGSFGAWRGASWYDLYLDLLRCEFRFVYRDSRRFYGLGFRLVLSR